MNRKELKGLKGKRIRYNRKSDYDRNRGMCLPYRYDTVVDVEGKNLFTEDDVLWADDLIDVKVIDETEENDNER